MKIVRNPVLSRASLPQWPAFDLVNSLPLRQLRAGGMVARILATYGIASAAAASAEVLAVILTDFTSRTAIHSNTFAHPSGSAANLSVLPVGLTWDDFNAKYAGAAPEGGSQAEADAKFWEGKSALTIFQTLYGTIDGNGSLAQDGMLQEYAPGQWRIRSFDTYRSVWCSYSNRVMEVLLGVVGMYGGTNHTNGHDQGLVYLPDIGWASADPTYNETHRTTDGRPLTIPELHDLSLVGATADIVAVKSAGPAHDPEAWSPAMPSTDSTYFGTGVHPVGMSIVGRNLVLAYSPALAADPNLTAWKKAAMADVFPDYGVIAVPIDNSVRLVTSVPFQREPALERRVGVSAWQEWNLRGDREPAGVGDVQYRVAPTQARVSGCTVTW